ncbi:MAG: hypothetical protein IBX55_19600 [Methyloprofundus sp.]|nr:hypothetical protein [Methyloprofundus sp.]
MSKDLINKSEVNSLFKIEPEESVDVSSKRILGHANSLLSQLPTLVGASQLADAYRIVMPAGVAGDLIKYKATGLLGTPILKDGKVVGHAGLESMSGLVSPMLIFSALSIVTGQYFLAQINESLDKVLDEVSKVKDLILIKEEAVIFSQGVFLERISNDYSYISSSADLKAATLVGIQQAINDLSAAVYFQSHNVEADLNAISLKNGLKTDKLKKSVTLLKTAFELRNMFTVLEFSLSQNFDSTSIESVQRTILGSNEKDFKPLMNKVFSAKSAMHEALNKEANTLSKQQQVSKFYQELKEMQLGLDMSSIERGNAQIEEAFSEVKRINEQGMEFLIVGDRVYID